MLLRLSIAAVFLFAQLSLSWASGVPMTAAAHGEHSGEAAHATGHFHPDSAAEDDAAHDSHDDCDCSLECHVCAMTLPSMVYVPLRIASFYEPAEPPQSVPPGTTAHPYRPPANS